MSTESTEKKSDWKPRPFSISWSTLDGYEDCPQQFLWTRGWYNIDLGFGMGRKKKPAKPSSEHHRMMGEVIGAVIERLYNDELWRDPKGLKDKLLELTHVIFLHQLQKAYIDWGRFGVPPQTEMLQICMDGVVGFLRTMKANKLLGPYAKAEVDLSVKLQDVLVYGRADLIIRRDDTGTMILDGKNSKSKGLYTDPDQLRLYALSYWRKFGTMPDRLGFIYYRYPFGSPVLDEAGEPTGELHQGVDWVDFTQADLEGLETRLLDTRALMEAHKFDPRPSPATCKYCDFESECSARQETKRKVRPKKTSIEAMIEESGGGLIEF